MLNVETERIEIDPLEAARYLGYKKDAPEPDVAEAIDEAISKVRSVSELRSFYARYPVERLRPGISDEARPDEDQVTELRIGEVRVTSKDLEKNLSGCSDAYLFGATLGIGLDRLIRKASVSSMSDAAIYQAVGAAYIESYCDVISSRILAAEEARDKKTKPRFSPGFGDFTIDYQTQIFRALGLSKNIGATLTDGMLMMPSKTVTAVIGVY